MFTEPMVNNCFTVLCKSSANICRRNSTKFSLKMFLLIVRNKYFINKHCVMTSREHTATSNMGDF